MAIFSGTITTGGQAQTLVPVSTYYTSGVFQNQSAGDLFIERGQPASAVAQKVAAGETVFFGEVDANAEWSVYGATTGQAYYCRVN